MDPNILFIVNPNSRSGKTSKMWESKILPQVLSFFPDANWSFTSCQYEASLLAYSAKKKGYDIVVAVGGDGTINEIVNGLMSNILIPNLRLFNSKIFGKSLTFSENKNEINKPTLACLPLGTGSDFVKSLGIPNNVKKALEVIKDGKQIYSDVGLIEFENKELKAESRYFINIAGCGANGETVKRMNDSKKHFGTRGSFLVAAIQTLLKNQSFPIQVSFDDEPFIPFDLRVLFVCNGQYCGGGMRLSKDASLQSGKLKVVQVRQMNKIKSIFLLDRLYSGNYKGLENDIFVREANVIKIKPLNYSSVPLECDGEMPGYLPAKFSILSGTLPVLVNI